MAEVIPVGLDERTLADGAWRARAVEVLARGGVTALPTESSYGLAVDALDEAALARLWQVKGRPDGRPPPVLIDGTGAAEGRGMIARLASQVPEAARRLIASHWPGPLTLALPARPGLPRAIVEAGFVAVRASSHPLAASLVRAFAGPITATSANRSGEPPAQDAVAATLAGVDLVLDGGAAPGGAPSTVARVHPDGTIEILRAGPIDPGAWPRSR